MKWKLKIKLSLNLTNFNILIDNPDYELFLRKQFDLLMSLHYIYEFIEF